MSSILYFFIDIIDTGQVLEIGIVQPAPSQGRILILISFVKIDASLIRIPVIVKNIPLSRTSWGLSVPSASHRVLPVVVR